MGGSEPQNRPDPRVRAAGRHLAGGDPNSAAQIFKAILEGQPDNADALQGLAVAMLELGRPRQAVGLLQRAAEIDDSAPVHYHLGAALWANGALEPAAEAYRTAIARGGSAADAHFNLGNVLLELHRPEEAIAAYRQAIELNPRDPDFFINLGNAQSASGAYEDAAESYDRAIDLSPANAVAYSNRGDAAREQGNEDEAEGFYRRALELAPGLAHAHYGLGLCLTTVGRIDDANLHFEKALESDPDLIAGYFELLANEKNLAERFDPQRMEKIADDPEIHERRRAFLHFGLARFYKSRKDIPKSFHHFEAGNRFRRRQLKFDIAEVSALADRITGALTGEFFAARRSFGVADEMPIFIVGMPRSGTTLVEQILASHGDVWAGGERLDIPEIARDILRSLPAGKDRRSPAHILELEEAQSRRLAKGYLDALRQRAPGATRATDKLPLNFLNLGLIALLLPGARIIHCRRNPMDTCLSCYFQNFRSGNGFAFDLAEIGQFYRQYQRLMTHWQRVLPLQTLEIQYEDLISHQETETRRLLDFCGLDWDARCLAFHETSRAVHTASVRQVRRPIYTSSVEQWRAYEEYLGPLIAALNAANGE